MRDKPRAYGPYKHGDKWRVHFVTGRGGDRSTSYETFDSWADAERCKSGATNEAQGISVSDAIKAYLDVKRAQGRSPETLSSYESRLDVLFGPLVSRPIRSIASRGEALYAATLAGRSPDAHQNLLRIGRMWGKFCVKRKWLKSNPFEDVEPVGQRAFGADKNRLTVDESRQLESWCLAHPSDIGAVLTLGYLYLGARNTELTKRDVRDLDDDGRLLWIGRTKSKAGRRKLSVPEGLSAMLVALCGSRPSDAPMFATKRGRMRRETARQHVIRVCKAAGVPVVPPQGLRRTASSLAAALRETPLEIARFLGHSTGEAPKVTERAYIERGAVSAAQSEARVRAIRSGRKRPDPWKQDGN
jgi:integrase